jgi:hypothetical protein
MTRFYCPFFRGKPSRNFPIVTNDLAEQNYTAAARALIKSKEFRWLYIPHNEWFAMSKLILTQAQDETEASLSQDEEIIQVVKGWFASHNYSIPTQISIRERNSNYWRVVVNSGSATEWWFQVDPKTGLILKAFGE